MFTVSHEHPDGRRDVYKALWTRFIPASEKEAAHVICGSPPAGTNAPIDCFVGKIATGRVYVMNEEGATVGTFRLSR